MKTSLHSPVAGAGFSLVEVLCAILILGVGLLGLVQGLATALASNKDSEVLTTAALIAAGRLELLRADGYVIEGEDTGECEELPLYHWRQTISHTSLEGLYDVAVAVENANTGRTIYELRTLLFDPPLAPAESQPAASSAVRRRERNSNR